MTRVDEIKAELAARERRIRDLWPILTVREIAVEVGMRRRSVQTAALRLGLGYRHANAEPKGDAA